MQGVDDGAVQHTPNYDKRSTEPTLLPVKLPMLLLNGVPGGSIGVGFSSQIPPHHPAELARASLLSVRARMEGRTVTVAELMTVMPGPDFPTGGQLGSTSDIIQAYTTGQGIMKMRSTVVIEPGDGRKGATLTFTSIPYAQTTEGVVTSIGEAAVGKYDSKTKTRSEATIPEIRDVRDGTTKNRRTGEVEVRIVVELKSGQNPQVCLEKLYQSTLLQTSYAVNMTALDENRQPIMLNLTDAIDRWINFRIDCIQRLANADLERARDRQHVVEGLVKSIKHIDTVVSIIKTSTDEETAIAMLREKIGLTTKQAESILAMQLRRLTGLRHQELIAEENTLKSRSTELIQLMTSTTAIGEMICSELEDAIRRFDRPRRTELIQIGAMDMRNFVVPEQILITRSLRGYLRKVPADEFRIQGRGGKGKRGAKVKNDDVLASVTGCHSLDRLFAITNSGVVVRLEAFDISDEQSGRHSVNMGFEEDEQVKAVFASPMPISTETQVVVSTSKGEVKRVPLEELNSKRTNRLIFFQNTAEDNIAGGVLLPDGSGDIFMASALGNGARFGSSEIRLSKRDSGGVRGMELRPNDQVVSIGHITSDDQLILCCTSDGIGKRVSAAQFPTQGRGIKGRILIKPRAGDTLVAALVVSDNDTVFIATEQGMTVRIRVSDVRELGRSAIGARLVTLNEGDRVLSMAILPPDEDVIEA